MAGEPPAPVRRRPNWRMIVPTAAGIVLILAGILFGVLAVRMVRNHTSLTSELGSLFVPAPQSVFSKDRIYVLVLGVDFNYDDKGMPYSKGARSDSIKVVGMDFASKTMRIVSILRDTEAHINGRDTKINEAYAIGGTKLADQVIGEFLGMPRTDAGTYFDRYIVVNSFGVKDFVDAIGGIDVPVTEQMDYDDSWGQLHIHFKPGLVHMNGEMAKGYSRFRHDACSDPCRVKRQDQVIKIVIGKLSHDKFNTIAHIGDLMRVANKNIFTNLTGNEEQSLAWAFKDAGPKALGSTEQIGYSDTKATPYAGEVLIPDEAQKTKIVADLLGPYAVATEAPAGALDAVKPATIHLVVQNGSGISGMGAAAAKVLKADGYIIDSVGNAKSFEYDVTQLRTQSKQPNVGERVRRDIALPGAVVAPATDTTPGPASVVTVIVGRDFAAAQASAVPAASPSTAR